MSNFFKNQYDPTVNEIREMFPSFDYGTKESWLSQFQNGYPLTPIQLAREAYKKLHDVTTSFKLDNLQRTNLQKMISGEYIDEKTGFEAYCYILTPKQMDYVGF